MDPQRCIGCHACEMACAECETNGQTPMASVDYVERYASPQTSVQICMHCEDPACAKVCPADAIQKDEFGIVHSANTARCPPQRPLPQLQLEVRGDEVFVVPSKHEEHSA